MITEPPKKSGVMIVSQTGAANAAPETEDSKSQTSKDANLTGDDADGSETNI